MPLPLSCQPRIRESWLRRQKTHQFSIEDGTSETAGHVSAGIYIDAVWQQFGPFSRRMTMHDDLAEIGPTLQKLVANPEKIFLRLTLKRNARTHTRMADEIATHKQGYSKRRNEAQVLWGNGRVE
jgi:hypothetical protein